MVDYYGIEEIGEIIIPFAKGVLFQIKGLEEFEETLEYWLAKEYAQIISEYINHTIKAVEDFLNYRYIDENSPLRREE